MSLTPLIHYLKNNHFLTQDQKITVNREFSKNLLKKIWYKKLYSGSKLLGVGSLRVFSAKSSFLNKFLYDARISTVFNIDKRLDRRFGSDELNIIFCGIE
jgi:hypothetical protein